MKITVEQLHNATADYVRPASRECVEIEDEGRLVVTLQPHTGTPARTGRGEFTEREARIRTMPLITIDSADVVSADRDAR